MKSLKRAFRSVGRTSKDFVKSRDQSPHPISFSYDDQTEYSSFFGGCLGLIATIFIALVFFSSLGTVLSRQQINASELRKVDPEAGTVTMPLKRGMMFAIGVEQLDFRYEKVFDLTFSRTIKFTKPRNQTEIRTSLEVKLVPCTPKAWEDLGLGQFYDQYSMNQMLCPDPNEIMKLSEERGYRLQIEQCGPQSPQPMSVSAYMKKINKYFEAYDTNPQWTEQLNAQFDLTLPENGGIPDNGDSLGGQEQEPYYEYEEEGEDNQTYYEQQEYYDQNGTLVSNSIPVSSDTDEPPSFDSIPCYFDFYKKVFKLPRQYKIQFYYVNSLINADQQEYFKRYVDYQEFTIQLTSHSMVRTEAEITLASYEVSTNNDIIFGREFWEEYKLDLDWNLEKRKGVIKLDPIVVNSLIFDPTDIDGDNTTDASGNAQKLNNYFTLDIKRSSQVLSVKRGYKTILSIINELGGLMTFLGMILGILVLQYNELSFNLGVVTKLYYSQKNQPLKIQKANYFYFLIYRFYSILESIGFEPDWKFCQEWKRVEENAAKLLDIQTVVKKVQHLQKVGLAVLDEEQYFALYLQEPHNLEDEDQRCEAEAVYQKLRAKCFQDGEFTEEGRNKLRMAMAMKNERKPSLYDDINQTSAKIQSSGSILQQKHINGFKVHDMSQIPEPEDDEEEEEEDRINREMLDKLKTYLLKLRAASKTNEVAARIYERIDINVRAILLNEISSLSEVIQVKSNEAEETVMKFMPNESKSKAIPKSGRK